jgi:uncharacterized protein YukE
MTTAKRTFGLIISLLLLTVPVVAWAQKQQIWDWWQLHDYAPASNIEELTREDKMTDYARKIFYVNHPELINNVNAFRHQCAQSEQTIVLGCYHPPQNGISVYDIQDSRLNGVEQVTAAHEMLHAAYDRLSSSEKQKVNTMLLDYYTNGLNNKRIVDTINAYKKTEPQELVNEMHSIFGTEVESLPPPLENYYKKYFLDRAAVVKYASGYQAEFTRRINQISSDDTVLTKLKGEIEAKEQSLNSQLQQIQSDRQNLNSLRDSGDVQQYNAAVYNFNSEIYTYNSSVRDLQNQITLYNNLVQKRNEVAKELRSLDGALDTRLTAQTVQ